MFCRFCYWFDWFLFEPDRVDDHLCRFVAAEDVASKTQVERMLCHERKQPEISTSLMTSQWSNLVTDDVTRGGSNSHLSLSGWLPQNEMFFKLNTCSFNLFWDSNSCDDVIDCVNHTFANCKQIKHEFLSCTYDNILWCHKNRCVAFLDSVGHLHSVFVYFQTAKWRVVHFLVGDDLFQGQVH